MWIAYNHICATILRMNGRRKYMRILDNCLKRARVINRYKESGIVPRPTSRGSLHLISLITVTNIELFAILFVFPTQNISPRNYFAYEGSNKFIEIDVIKCY